MAKPNHFWKAYMRPFWYFNVSLGSGEKSFAFQDCAWIVILLHTERTENPHTPKTHLSASNFCKYPSDIPQTPPDIPKTSSWHLQGTQNANRRQQTPPDTQRQCQMLFEYVWQCPLASVVVCWHVMFPGDVWVCLGDVWGVSERYLSGIYGNWRRLNKYLLHA